MSSHHTLRGTVSSGSPLDTLRPLHRRVGCDVLPGAGPGSALRDEGPKTRSSLLNCDPTTTLPTISGPLAGRALEHGRTTSYSNIPAFGCAASAPARPHRLHRAHPRLPADPPSPTAASAAKTTITAASMSIPADGKSHTMITVQAKDVSGHDAPRLGRPGRAHHYRWNLRFSPPVGERQAHDGACTTTSHRPRPARSPLFGGRSPGRRSSARPSSPSSRPRAAATRRRPRRSAHFRSWTGWALFYFVMGVIGAHCTATLGLAWSGGVKAGRVAGAEAEGQDEAAERRTRHTLASARARSPSAVAAHAIPEPRELALPRELDELELGSCRAAAGGAALPRRASPGRCPRGSRRAGPCRRTGQRGRLRPTSQMFLSPRGSAIASCTGATSPWTNRLPRRERRQLTMREHPARRVAVHRPPLGVIEKVFVIEHHSYVVAPIASRRRRRRSL